MGSHNQMPVFGIVNRLHVNAHAVVVTAVWSGTPDVVASETVSESLPGSTFRVVRHSALKRRRAHHRCFRERVASRDASSDLQHTTVTRGSVCVHAQYGGLRRVWWPVDPNPAARRCARRYRLVKVCREEHINVGIGVAVDAGSRVITPAEPSDGDVVKCRGSTVGVEALKHHVHSADALCSVSVNEGVCPDWENVLDVPPISRIMHLLNMNANSAVVVRIRHSRPNVIFRKPRAEPLPYAAFHPVVDPTTTSNLSETSLAVKLWWGLLPFSHAFVRRLCKAIIFMQTTA